jgi:DNA-binding XRE family transcriptional regulator
MRKDDNQSTREHFAVEADKLSINIRDLRNAYHETQEDLALAINVTKTAISNYENGNRTPSIFEILGIAHHYRLTVERLLYGDYHNRTIHDSMQVNREDVSKSIWSILLKTAATEQARQNESFEKAYTMHLKIIDSIGKNNYTSMNDFAVQCESMQALYKQALNEGVLEANVNLLWYPMYISIGVSSLTKRFLEHGTYREQDATALQILKETMMPAIDDPSDDDICEWKDAMLEDLRLEIYSQIRSLKEAGPKEYRDLADYYIALMYRFDFRTDALSSEESYVIGQELLTMGLIMENPFAAEYLESFSVFHQ